jgi:hypothetical protein
MPVTAQRHVLTSVVIVIGAVTSTRTTIQVDSSDQLLHEQPKRRASLLG